MDFIMMALLKKINLFKDQDIYRWLVDKNMKDKFPRANLMVMEGLLMKMEDILKENLLMEKNRAKE